MSNLLTRAISGFIYVSLFLSAIFFSEKSYIILTAIFASISLWEFAKMIRFKNIIPYLLLPCIIYLFVAYASANNLFLVAIITLLCSFRLVYHLYSENITYPNTFFDKMDLCIRYVILPFSFLIVLPFVNNIYHPSIVVAILVLIWINDSFAYLVGKNFGKRKLFERISPKKTIEGFIGGVIFSLIAAFVISQYLPHFNTLSWIIIAAIVAIFGTLGDLVESKFKRQANVKDSGNIMPGHGGMLDRLDSLFFAAPFVYLYIHYFLQ
ncbi:phosphatidate cytidylyltransferase [Tenacibaculum maritimum]|uniref:phosphatidate cytidylyltransferase n=1 Tax=Tenacibaculum maritimum TaxID=107401 RepID=UPI0010A2D7C1|nr:phosphatidate cytidylyltransferase [Tenacibaculum maritimum]MCD9583790.1 phosphatidate cytidylyltransferase [Tenacibaculum maritimum]MCD9611012.1 phosphatidate cytidylyltransferase [Tenacibaculum maritimum]MCD9619518.1 phosphatidate cytidylyltransferase [Tenacibaculum maritimum]MCD9626140.1 phosphatidate cytidylyltransferase [Tenacibaculum maritimum]MCD9629132.1 phosphatidate cytidylyltransferase [Tenacibaculum maritimum]